MRVSWVKSETSPCTQRSRRDGGGRLTAPDWRAGNRCNKPGNLRGLCWVAARGVDLCNHLQKSWKFTQRPQLGSVMRPPSRWCQQYIALSLEMLPTVATVGRTSVLRAGQGLRHLWVWFKGQLAVTSSLLPPSKGSKKASTITSFILKVWNILKNILEHSTSFREIWPAGFFELFNCDCPQSVSSCASCLTSTTFCKSSFVLWFGGSDVFSFIEDRFMFLFPLLLTKEAMLNLFYYD